MKREFALAVSAVMVAGLVFLNGCTEENNPSGPGAIAHTDTSIFLGTWVEVFDTSTVESREYWCGHLSGGCFEPDTMWFHTDSSVGVSSWVTGGRRRYWYSTDTLFLVDFGEGLVLKADTTAYAYSISSDSLLLDRGGEGYLPVFFRGSE